MKRMPMRMNGPSIVSPYAMPVLRSIFIGMSTIEYGRGCGVVPGARLSGDSSQSEGVKKIERGRTLCSGFDGDSRIR